MHLVLWAKTSASCSLCQVCCLRGARQWHCMLSLLHDGIWVNMWVTSSQLVVSREPCPLVAPHHSGSGSAKPSNMQINARRVRWGAKPRGNKLKLNLSWGPCARCCWAEGEANIAWLSAAVFVVSWTWGPALLELSLNVLIEFIWVLHPRQNSMAIVRKTLLMPAFHLASSMQNMC